MTIFCRVCLTANVRMYDLSKSYLLELYEKLINYNVNAYNVIHCCYICHSLLKKSYQLLLQAVNSNEVLTQAEENKAVITDTKTNTFNLTKVKLDDIVIDTTNDVVVKDGNYKARDDDDFVKAESDEFDDIVDNKPEYLDSVQTDSEDDVPLSELAPQTDTQIIKERNYTEYKNINAREIILTKDEQLREMQDRAKSINYLNSPYKCDLCYRGFVDPTAFGKHREKHDESNGSYECEVCHLRYPSKRQMTSHYKSAHNRKFECNICKQITHTRNQAKQHEEWHKGRTYTCNLCGKSFVKLSSYFTHVRKLHASKYACASCGERFVSAHGLRMHVTKTHRGDEEDKKDEPILDSYCKECDIQFKSMEAWKKHVLINHYSFDSKSSICPICNEDITSEERLAHIRTHTDTQTNGEHTYEKSPALTTLNCKHCDAIFYSTYKLSAHMRRVHLGLKYDKNIVCEVCGKHCTSLATLRYHQRRHSGERPFPCATCGARFASKEHLRIHNRTHSGERPYACPICGKKFTQKPALTRHYRVHSGSKPYECQYCSKRFNQSSSVKSHVNTVHLKIPRNVKKNITNKVC